MNTQRRQDRSDPVGSGWRDPTADGHQIVHLVDFKWLMAGLGWWVDLNRLQRDAAYAAECYSRAATSSCEPLRRSAATLMQLLPLLRH
jgi:hypothetical protein